MHAHASLNRAYRLVWNAALGAVVAAPETARGGSAPGIAPEGAAFPLRRLVLAMALALGTPAGWAVDAGALPKDGSLAAGNATWGTTGSTLTVNQASPRAIVNWGGFDVGSAATVKFVQPSASSVILNRVTGGGASQIDGALSANGQVYLVNPAGVLFGKTAQVDVGGLTASTLSISDEDFLAGRDRFTRDGSTGAVVNEGRISVQPGGRVVLLGATVDNKGQIFAPGGDVALAAGRQVTLGVGANGHLQVAVDAADVATMVANGGLVQADGGQIVLTARGADTLASAVVSNTGTLQARTVASHGGRILLLADMEHGTAQVGGTLDASAPAGGDGGFVETSAAHVAIAPGTRVNTLAASGRTGTWLIDPQDITIIAGTPASADEVSAADIQANLQTSNVTIATSASGTGAGDINVNADLAWSAQTLTLSAHNDVILNAVMTASGTAGLALNYGGTSGSSSATPAAGSGITTGQRGRVDFTGTGNTLAINGNAYTILTSLGADGSTTGTDLQGVNGNLSGNYALGADIDAASTSGWGSGAGFAPIGTTTTAFTGTFEGLGHVVNSLTINQPSGGDIGLFGVVGAGGTVRNLTVANANMTAQGFVGTVAGSNAGLLSNVGGQGTLFAGSGAGGLVGTNTGTIERSWARASVHTTANYAGGLVGLSANGSVIDRSWADGTLSVEGLSAGGLVGLLGGTIRDSYATGSITSLSPAADNLGGLVGRSAGATASIQRSYTDVQLGSATHVGGVIGLGNIATTDVYWDSTRTGAATGSGSGVAVGTGVTTAQLESGLPANFASTTWGNAGNRSTPYLLANAGPVRLATDASGAHYQIVLDAAQLQAMADSVRSGGVAGNYALGNDIDASVTRGWNAGAGFAPVGSGATNAFSGTFDGLGYTITGLFIDRPSANAGGLFGTAQGGGVRDLTIAAADVRTASSAGVLASSWNAGTIERVNVSGTVQVLTIGGGLLGGAGAGTVIEDSHADVSVSAQALSTARAGGLVGLNAGTIRRSSASGAVDGVGAQAGGLAGQSSGVIEDSMASGAVTSSGAGTGTAHGGLVGTNTGSITRSYATGAVTGNGSLYGGLVGSNSASGTITQSWASGDVVHGGSGGNVGGLAGSNAGSITDAFALGNVQAGSPGTSAGGLAGVNSGSIARTYASGAVAGGSASGLVGRSSGTISDSVWNGDANAVGIADNTGTVTNTSGQGAAAMRQLSTYTALGWDIDAGAGTGTTWRIYEGSTTPWLRVFLAPLTVTVSGTLGSTTYDGAAGTGAVAAANVSLSDPAATPSGSLAYVTTGKNAGSYSTTAGNLSFTGLYSGPAGYDIAYAGTSSATITPKALTVTGATAQDKVYDGTNTATVGGGALSGVVGSDVVTLSLGGASFGDKNAGTGKAVTVAGSALGGADAGNYTVADPTGLSATITPATLASVSGITAADRVYDGTTTAAVDRSGATVTGAIAGDDVQVSGATGNFTDKNAGTGKTVNFGGITLGGADGGNYQVTGATTVATATASITPRDVAGTVTAADKVYDGNTSAVTSGGVTGAVAGDDVRVASIGTFTSRNVGTNTVFVSGATLAGADAGNYHLTGTNATTTATITPKSLTGTVTAADKVYNGTDAATTSGTLAGVVAGDDVSLASTGLFSDKNVGVGKTVNVSGASLGGADAGNYVLAGSNATTTASITPKALTATVTAADKVYDGNTTATGGGSVTGVIGTDVVTVAATGTFDTKNAGTGKTVTITSVTLGGADAGNYSVTGNATTTAAITPKSITGTVTASDKVYDGTTAATLGGSLAGVVAGDSVTVGGTGTFSDKNVGMKTVTVSTASLGGADAGNYDLSGTNATTTASITPKAVTGTLTAADKVYDGNTTAVTGGSVAGLVGADVVTLAATGTFDTKDAGTGKTVTLTGVTIGGADAGNYTVASNATTTAAITPKAITGTITASGKVYDGTTTASTSGNLSGVVAGDTVTLASSGAFGDKNAGVGKTVNVAGSLAGADAANYSVSTNATTTADITPRTVTGAITAAGKVYDGGTAATTGGTLSGVLAGDTVTLATSGSFADPNAGTGKVVNVGGVLGGSDAGNYVLAANATTAADIARAPLLGTANDAVKFADGAAYAGGNGVSYSGFAPGDGAWVLSGSLLWGGTAQGAVQPGQYGITVSGLLAANYDITWRDGLLAILPAQAVPAPGDIDRRAWLALIAPPASPSPAAELVALPRLPLVIAPDFLRLPE